MRNSLPGDRKMKTVGMIGGIGPESTIEYYRSIIAAYREQKLDGSYPSIIINSIDLKKLLDLIAANQLANVTEYLVAEVQKLARAGADCGLLAANTPHIVFDEIRRGSPFPLVSIVEATCQAAKALGLKDSVCLAHVSPCKGDSIHTYFLRKGLLWPYPTRTSKPTFMTNT